MPCNTRKTQNLHVKVEKVATKLACGDWTVFFSQFKQNKTNMLQGIETTGVHEYSSFSIDTVLKNQIL